jgi:hypothetical protein
MGLEIQFFYAGHRIAILLLLESCHRGVRSGRAFTAGQSGNLQIANSEFRILQDCEQLAIQ